MSSQDNAHSPYGASGAHRWTNCTASIEHLIEHPMPESEDAKKGTDAHEYVMDPITGCIEYQEAIRDIKKSLGKFESLHEERVEYSSLILGAYGTPDYAIWDDFAPLHVLDYKNGYQFVDAVENKQLMWYALAIIDQYKLSPSEVVLHIFQPNRNDGDPHRTEKVSMEVLKEYETELRLKIRDIETKKPEYKTGDWCQFCNKAECPQFDTKLATVEKAAPDLAGKTSEQLVTLLSTKKFVTGAYNDAEAILMQRAMDGQKIPGKKLVHGVGNRVWNTEDPEMIAESIGISVGISEKDMLKTEIISPAQTEKLIKSVVKGDARKQALNAVDKLTVKPEKSPKLVEEGAKGEPYLLESFDKIT